MEKISEKTNVITWLEIPVTDTERAREFYQTIFDIKMETVENHDAKEELTFFPRDPNVIQSTSGRVAGVLSKNGQSKPSMDGVIIYLNAGPTIQTVIDKIEPAGGKVVMPRTEMQAGFIAMFVDTEGNKLGLHSEG